MQSEMVRIGWQISTLHWTISLTSEKREAILDDLNEILRVHKLSIKLLEKVTGKFLCVTSAWHQLRPLLNSFYHAMGSPSPTLVSISHQEWKQLLRPLNADCMITAKSNHPTLGVGVRLFRVGSCNVTSLQQLNDMSVSSRRIWVSISDPHSPWRKMTMTGELKSSSEAWRMLLSSTSSNATQQLLMLWLQIR